jgi:predicted transcriptional regulator
MFEMYVDMCLPADIKQGGSEPDKDLEEALQLMARHQVRRLPVVENGRLVGIVAQTDIALSEKREEDR